MAKEDESVNIETIRELIKLHREVTVIPTESSVHLSEMTEDFSIKSED